jgi:hypothetical protein
LSELHFTATLLEHRHCRWRPKTIQ